MAHTMLPCSGRTLLLSLLSLLLFTIVEVCVFKSLDDRLFVIAVRLHVWGFVELSLFACAWYVWRRVSQLFNTKNLLTFGGLFRVCLFVVLSLSLLATLVGFFLVQIDPSLFALLCTFSVGLVIFLMTSLFIADVTSFIIRRVVCPIFTSRKELLKGDQTDSGKLSSSRNSSDSTNKLELKIRILLALIFALFLATIGVVGITRLTIERVQVPIKGLPQTLNGTTIVQISDIHLGPFIGRTRLKGILELVNQLEGDIVVITGDLVDASVARLKETVKPLATIKSKHGVFYITGNHEYYTGDVENWIAEVARLKINPLVNERKCLYSIEDSCKGGLYIAGLADWEARRHGPHTMDIDAALTGRTKGVPTIVLAHQPRAAAKAIIWDDVRLVLSGHTHGGQIFPWMVFIYLTNPFFVGLYQPRPDVYVYVNPGTLYFMIPFRHYRPEITHITLLSA